MCFFFFQAEDGIRDLVRSRGLGDVYKRQVENVALPLIYAGFKKSDRIKRAEEILKAVNLGHRMNHKPNELSGGERQRVAVARALVNNPSIILADEPTGNLDTKTSYEIMELFEEIHKKGNTVIIVTHEEDIARYAHRIIRIRDGKIERDEINANKLDPSELRKQLV